MKTFSTAALLSALLPFVHSIPQLAPSSSSTPTLPHTTQTSSAQPTASPWTAASGTYSVCSTTTDKIIGFYIGPQLQSVVHDACNAMIAPCSGVSNSSPGCEVPVLGSVNSTQDANVEDLHGNKLSGWRVYFQITPSQNATEISHEDCEGYFTYLFNEFPPNGCHRWEGFGIGNLTVGTQNGLTDTLFMVEIVPRESRVLGLLCLPVL